MATEVVHEGGDPYFGRGKEKWEAMVRTVEARLIECAKGNTQTTYEDVNIRLKHANLPTFNFRENREDPHAIGVLLWQISMKSYEENVILLSAICRQSNGERVGEGFWKMVTEDLQLAPTDLKPKEKSILLKLFSRQVKDYYKRFR